MQGQEGATVVKLCECGCGGMAKRRFILGHNTCKSDQSPFWKGGRSRHTEGYMRLLMPDGTYELEHIVIAATVLGRPLPPGVEVHHVNGKRAENAHRNLVICENRAYHRLLHKRQRAVEAGVPAHWLKCWKCKQYDSPQTVLVFGPPNQLRAPIHRTCKRELDRERTRRKRT
jgi:hypothetical protein